MRDVTAWLQELGLAKYANVFQEHEIDLEALPHLSEAMLEQIGVPVGPRAKLLAAIAQLSDSAPSSSRAGYGDAAANAPEQGREAERRQITVMFSDLVDSTKLANCLDPEDLRSVMQAYQKTCASAIERYEGHVAQYLGDGVMAYFGWPSAHEDAPERAVRAGLEIVERVGAIGGKENLSVRIGVSTGIVVIAESGHGDPSIADGAVGETPHVAARLQGLATVNSVVISETTSRLVSKRFDLEALGPHQLKGVVKPLNVYRVCGVREDSNRFQLAHVAGLTPLVGRSAELALLQQRWADAREGEGQVVVVSGVPGIGKSRIVHELEATIGNEPKFVLKFQCSPHFMQSPFFPLIQQFERLGRFADGASDRARLATIEKILSFGFDKTDRTAELIAEMLSIRGHQSDETIRLSAQQVKSETLFMLVQYLVGLSERRPVFCLFEDAHWIDPSTQELLDLVTSRIDKARVLLVVTHRPGYQHHWSARGNLSAITLSRLSRDDAAKLAKFAFRDQFVSSATMSRIVEESDYIPLFVEELVRATTERGGIGEQTAEDHTADQSATWTVPDSLRDSLMARLDRVPQARHVAQIAAVLGRDFSYDLLRQISAMSSSEMDGALAHLERSEIVQSIDTVPTARYAFRHALVRDAAYESLLKSRRREIHARVGEVLEKEWPDLVTSQPELLAYHFGQAGLNNLSAQYWLRGGRRARNRSANLEAAEQFQKALKILQSLPETPDRKAMELEAQLLLGLSFVSVRGYSADETRQSFERAHELSAELAESHKDIQATFGLWGHYWMRAQHDRARQYSQLLLAKAKELKDTEALVIGHRCLGSTLFTFGDFPAAQTHLKKTMSLAQKLRNEKMSLSYAVDPQIAALLLLAWNTWIMGYPSRALDQSLQALARASKQADPYGIAFAEYVTSAVLLLRGDLQDSFDHAERSLALSIEHRINLYALYARFGRGCALIGLGEESQAIVEIREGIEEARLSQLGYMRAFMLGWLGTAQAATGDLEAARITIDEALEHINDVDGRAWEAEVTRLSGDLSLAVHPEAVRDAEQSYNCAIEVAKRQQARSLELRATLSLAKLLRKQGQRQEARERLAETYEWFTEGHDTADLRAAAALLSELG